MLDHALQLRKNLTMAQSSQRLGGGETPGDLRAVQRHHQLLSWRLWQRLQCIERRHQFTVKIGYRPRPECDRPHAAVARADRQLVVDEVEVDLK